MTNTLVSKLPKLRGMLKPKMYKVYKFQKYFRNVLNSKFFEFFEYFKHNITHLLTISVGLVCYM